MPLFSLSLLKNSSYSSLLLQTTTWPLTQPISPTRLGTIQFRVPHGPSLLSWRPVSVGAHRPCVFATSSLFFPCDFKNPDSTWCCSNLVWHGRELLTWLSPKKPAVDLAGAGPGDRSHPGPHAGPRDLIVLKHSPYCLVFQCPLQFLFSSLHICWDTVSCLLCSSEDRQGVSHLCRGKWTPLPPILPPP